MTDINVGELIAEARRAVKALGVRQSSMLINRLADALEAVEHERDEALAFIERVKGWGDKPAAEQATTPRLTRRTTSATRRGCSA